MYKLRYRISTCLCIILLAVQINSLVNAAEISDGTETEIVGMSTVTEPEEETVENSEEAEAVSDEEVIVQDEGALQPDSEKSEEEAEDQSVEEPEEENAGLDEAEEDAPDESDLPEEEKADAAAEKKEVVDLDVPDDVVAMRVPKNLDFVLDPYELMEKGSIWSQEYAFKNSGETPILLKFSSIQLFLQDEIEMAADEMTDEDIADASNRTVRLLLLQKEPDKQNEDEADEPVVSDEVKEQEESDKPEPIKVTKEGCDYETVLEPGQEFGFVIGGQISKNPAVMWQTGDVSIKMVYAAEVYRETETADETVDETAVLSK